MPDLAQTPGFWVDAATLAQWGADCVAAMLSCGLDPGNFGSYSDVRNKIDAAQGRVAAWNAAKRIQDPVERAREMQRQGGPPSANDYYLSRCESGHVMQNAAAQATSIRNPDGTTTSAGRHDRCANLIDGYSQGGAPAMPMTGRNTAERRGGWPPEEHDRVGAMEASQANARAQAAGHTNQPGQQSPRGLDYPPDQRHADQRARNREYAQAHVDSKRRELSDTRAARERSAYEQTVAQATGAANSGGAAGTDDGTAAKPSGVSPDSDTINKAGDCISAQAERAEAEMIAECGKNASANAELAASPAHQEEVARLHQGYQAARAEEAETREALRNGQTPKVPIWVARQRTREARDAYEHASSVGCAAEQGARINEGQGNTTGRIPGGAFDSTVPPQIPGVNPQPTTPPGGGQGATPGGQAPVSNPTM